MSKEVLKNRVAEEFHELVSTNYLGLAGFVVLVYDHILTFNDEIQYIWHGKKKIVIWLFLINRYVTPLGFIINLNAYMSPSWSIETCRQFVVYEGIMGFFGVAVASLMMLVRIHAIYYGDLYVMSIMWLLFWGMVIVNVWLLTTTGPVIHPGIAGCSMLFGQSHNIGRWVSATAWTPLCFDTVVIALVIFRTRRIVLAKIAEQSKVVTVLIRDGIMYFSVILAVNLVLAVMIVRAPDGIKNIFAQFQLILTVTMMSRITLNLRKNMDRTLSMPSHMSVPFSDERVRMQLRDLEVPPKVYSWSRSYRS